MRRGRRTWIRAHALALLTVSSPAAGTFTQFNPTPPSQRLVKTFSEVQSFKRQLLLAEKGLQNHAQATAGAFADMY